MPLESICDVSVLPSHDILDALCHFAGLPIRFFDKIRVYGLGLPQAEKNSPLGVGWINYVLFEIVN